MRIISERRVRDFAERYTDSALAPANWKRAVRAARWRHQGEVKAQFSDSDLVGERTVFNISKNRYRLVAFINFQAGILYIKEILPHKDYDKGH